MHAYDVLLTKYFAIQIFKRQVPPENHLFQTAVLNVNFGECTLVMDLVFAEGGGSSHCVTPFTYKKNCLLRPQGNDFGSMEQHVKFPSLIGLIQVIYFTCIIFF
eukprot:TRINITY_DN11159_c0_g1_i1.p10 TRINITY_DN11159_c0_g1~~TRINITY_DN11159_c0_g1_i1.p10  ORF type:complete len:104 (-),score=3.85 TRINITY_DN11159_c0_g1_i1:1100-1411(-)